MWDIPRKFKERAFKGTPQYTVDDLYTPPFTAYRHFDTNGVMYYLPLEVERRTTGVNVFDEYLAYLLRGRRNITGFAERYGLRVEDIDSMVFILTGMRGVDFRMALQVRLADDLLRYTDLQMAEVAARSGFGSANNLYLTCKREFGVAPGKRRKTLRQQGDAGRYRL